MHQKSSCTIIENGKRAGGPLVPFWEIWSQPTNNISIALNNSICTGFMYDLESHIVNCIFFHRFMQSHFYDTLQLLFIYVTCFLRYFQTCVLDFIINNIFPTFHMQIVVQIISNVVFKKNKLKNKRVILTTSIQMCSSK